MRSLFILRCPSRLSHKAKSIHTSSVRYQKQVPSFTYSLATSFHGKTPKKTTTAFEPSSDIAHWRDSVLEGSSWPVDAGEDFLFTKRLADEVLLGVCDGVGGWSEHGPAVIAQGLCYHASSSALESYRLSGLLPDPAKIMQTAYDRVLKDPQIKAGATTACFLSLSSTGMLQAANLGDSTFAIVREEKVVHFQAAQTHYFNCPLQLQKTPWGELADVPSQADVFDFTLRDKDLILVMTDGISDNVFPEELAQIIQRVNSSDSSSQERLQTIAKTAVMFARLVGQSETKETPFSVEARKHGYEAPGGKLDDCTMIATMAHCA